MINHGQISSSYSSVCIWQLISKYSFAYIITSSLDLELATSKAKAISLYWTWGGESQIARLSELPSGQRLLPGVASMEVGWGGVQGHLRYSYVSVFLIFAYFILDLGS